MNCSQVVHCCLNACNLQKMCPMKIRVDMVCVWVLWCVSVVSHVLDVAQRYKCLLCEHNR